MFHDLLTAPILNLRLQEYSMKQCANLNRRSRAFGSRVRRVDLRAMVGCPPGQLGAMVECRKSLILRDRLETRRHPCPFVDT